ncbi:MAG: HlyC/CorC family transporter [Mycobacterium sp.]|nr:HlyC/CorC family transporter [Mycobacterium sp.]
MSLTFILLSLLAIVVLTLGTAVFVAAEFSLTALERSTVDANARSGDRRDRFVQRAHRTLSFQLSGAQLGISITTLGTGFLAEPVLARLLTPALEAARLPRSAVPTIALIVAIVLATSLSMVFGELVPKNLAVARPVQTARASSGPQLAFSWLFAPAIRLTNGIANRILRRLGIEPADELRSARSPQELGSLVRSSAERGAIDEETAGLVDRSLRFGRRTAEEFMTPRTEIEVLQTTDTVADLRQAATATGFSRFPVVKGDLDETVGIVHVKQIFEVPRSERATTRLDRLVIPVPKVPSTLDGDALMIQVRANGLQTALVVDEYGGTAGMVTFEDLSEEIVGDVRDEHDDATPDVRRVGNGWEVAGLLRIDEVAEATGFRGCQGQYETIGGLVLERMGHIPHPGESVFLSASEPEGPTAHPLAWRATVVAMDGRRIDRITLTQPPSDSGAQAGN